MSDTTLSNLESEDKDYRELDGNGLYFFVQKNGNKSWQLRYKKPNGKWSWLGIGGYPEIGGQLARKKAQELIADIGKGENPIITKQERKAKELEESNATFEALAKEWIDTKQNTWVADTLTRNRGALEKHIYPIFGKRLFVSIRPIEWMEHLKGIQQEQKIYEQVKRIRTMCRDIYDYAKVTGRIDYNPLEGLHKFLESGKKENMAHVDEKDLPALLRAIDNYPTPDIRIGLKLLTMLFCRPSELREAQWHEFDLDEGLWNIPEERMKKRRTHIVPLTEQALVLLEAIKPYSGHREYVFPADRNPRTHCNSQTANMALKRMGFEGRLVSHGMRSMASTILNEHAWDPELIEVALAHVDKDEVRSAYNRADYIERRRPMMAWWSEHIQQAATGNLSMSAIKENRDRKVVSIR